MMKDNVMLVGLAQNAWDAKNDLRWAADNDAEMWTLNNFYAAPWLLPYYFEKSFQIHEDDLGDYWPINYNMSGTTAVILDTAMDKYFKMLDRFETTSMREAEQMGSVFMSSTFAYMLKTCRGRKSVRITGIEMRYDGEYQYQAPGVLLWVDKLRGEGVKIDFPLEEKIRSGIMCIDWKKLQAVDVVYGSRKWRNPNGAPKITIM